MEAIPLEINEQIALSIHPYYVRNICNINKRSRNECDAWTYQALQKWVYPEKSVSELQSLFPVLHFNDVIYLSLVFNPITESKLYFDWTTLFYHACRVGQDNSSQYLNDSIETLHIAVNIAYKFNRYDIIDNFINSRQLVESDSQWFKVMANISRAKSKKDILYPIEYIDNLVETFINRYPLFTYEDIIEFVIIYRGLLAYPDNEFNEDGWYYDYLTGEYQGVGSDIQVDFTYIANKVGVYKVRDIFTKYGLEAPKEVNYLEPLYISIETLGVVNFEALEKNRSFGKVINSITLFENHNLVSLYIPEDKLGIYYVTSGDFAAYVNWLRKQERNIVPLEYPYYGINEFRSLSLDADLVNVTRNKGDESVRYITLKNGVRLDQPIIYY